MMSEKTPDNQAWQAATFEGATREALRRWRAVSLEQIIMVLEEMQELGQWLHGGAPGKSEANVRESLSGDDKIDKEKQG